jgi:hypothetical protein
VLEIFIILSIFALAMLMGTDVIYSQMKITKLSKPRRRLYTDVVSLGLIIPAIDPHPV